ncbi:MAG: non-canonical purine NTP diphosphatase [Chitinophagales bacterium]|nr:non-canonical purine NTP diphosphatase [Chitinophagales bacterium]
MRLIFATQNQHKRDEVQALIGNSLSVSSLQDFNFRNELPETSDSLEGNALQKAEFIYNKLHQDCFAEDTGLEIEALNNKPGVFSARYAGNQKNSDDNINLVLTEMEGIENRRARFRTVICLYLESGRYYFEGIVNGTIVSEKRGKSGFGYDPIFIPDGTDKTFAEMSDNEKNEISHRGKAIKNMMEFLESKVR